MEESRGWQPAGRPSDLQIGRHNFGDPRTGAVHLRNGSNWFFGALVAWGLLALDAVLLNRSALTRADPMAPAEILLNASWTFALSMLGRVVLSRPSVRITDGIAEVRNPLRVYSFPLAAVEETTFGFFGFPRCRVAGRTIRLMAMQNSSLEQRGGGNEISHVWRAEVADAKQHHPAERGDALRRHGIWTDWWTGSLLLGWFLYALSFLV